MSENWPPLDMHAHVDPSIIPDDLLGLRAVVFAATRTLDESTIALDRQASDLLTTWGVGTHPGVKAALESYDEGRFRALIARSAYVGEVGLDGRVQSRLDLQRSVLSSILSVLQKSPRITSLHSYAATTEMLEALEEIPIEGAVLHWWLGDRAATERAVALGAYFSVNASNLKNIDALDAVPTERLLTETDHPDGNRWSPRPNQPGNVLKVEEALGARRGVSPVAFREVCWQNLRTLAESIHTVELLPPRIRAVLLAA